MMVDIDAETVNDWDLVAVIAKRLGMAESSVAASLQGFLSALRGAIKGGRRVELRGFGVFSVGQRGGRQGIGPKWKAASVMGASTRKRKMLVKRVKKVGDAQARDVGCEKRPEPGLCDKGHFTSYMDCPRCEAQERVRERVLGEKVTMRPPKPVEAVSGVGVEIRVGRPEKKWRLVGGEWVQV